MNMRLDVEAVVHDARTPVTRFLRRRYGLPEEEAEALFHDAVVLMIEKLDACSLSYPSRSLLTKLAQGLAANRARTVSTRARILRDHAAEIGPDETSGEAAIVPDRVLARLATVDSELAEIFLLRTVLGHSSREVAKSYALTPGSVDRRRDRVRDELVASLEDDARKPRRKVVLLELLRPLLARASAWLGRWRRAATLAVSMALVATAVGPSSEGTGAADISDVAMGASVYGTEALAVSAVASVSMEGAASVQEPACSVTGGALDVHGNGDAAADDGSAMSHFQAAAHAGTISRTASAESEVVGAVPTRSDRTRVGSAARGTVPMRSAPDGTRAERAVLGAVPTRSAPDGAEPAVLGAVPTRSAPDGTHAVVANAGAMSDPGADGATVVDGDAVEEPRVQPDDGAAALEGDGEEEVHSVFGPHAELADIDITPRGIGEWAPEREAPQSKNRREHAEGPVAVEEAPCDPSAPPGEGDCEDLPEQAAVVNAIERAARAGDWSAVTTISEAYIERWPFGAWEVRARLLRAQALHESRMWPELVAAASTMRDWPELEAHLAALDRWSLEGLAALGRCSEARARQARGELTLSRREVRGVCDEQPM